MGITISCKRTGRSIDLGCFGFLRLRRKVAELQGGPFQEVYEEICAWSPGRTGETDQEFDARINARAETILSAKQADPKVVDFLLQSDCGGRIHYGACMNLLRVIGDYDDDILYGYCVRPDCAKFADFRAILEDCAATRSDLVWW